MADHSGKGHTMTLSRRTEALAVLNATQHRGARNWHYDGKQARVMPEAGDEPDYPPIFTAFEAMSVARRLVAIGALARYGRTG
jgi:hypothetical protein